MRGSSDRSRHLKAVLQALLVTFLWSTSWVLIKLGLKDIPALTFAGLRYCLAFLCLLPFLLRPTIRAQLRQIHPPDWIRLVVLGVLFYAITQGTQFLGLAYLPAVTVSILLNSTALFVAFMGIIFLNERPTPLQWSGIGLFLLGVLGYFFPISFPAQQWLGILFVFAGVLANAGSAILGRSINRARNLTPFIVTLISMGIGSVLLLGAGILTQGLPEITPINWLIIAWLALVNTALAFTLWNQTLQELSAFESTTINGTMLVQIAILAWIFLDESLNLQEISGLVLIVTGAVLVQWRRNSPSYPGDIATE